MDSKEQSENPINRGKTVSETYLPITILIGTAINVDINPVIAEAIPAI